MRCCGPLPLLWQLGLQWDKHSWGSVFTSHVRSSGDWLRVFAQEIRCYTKNQRWRSRKYRTLIGYWTWKKKKFGIIFKTGYLVDGRAIAKVENTGAVEKNGLSLCFEMFLGQTLKTIIDQKRHKTEVQDAGSKRWTDWVLWMTVGAMSVPGPRQGT